MEKNVLDNLLKVPELITDKENRIKQFLDLGLWDRHQCITSVSTDISWSMEASLQLFHFKHFLNVNKLTKIIW